LKISSNRETIADQTDQQLLSRIGAEMQASLTTLQQAITVLGEPVAAAAAILIKALAAEHGVFSCGNGGSAADAQHFSAELQGRFLRQRPALRVMALTTDTSSLTSIANDFSFSQVFSRQLQGLGRPGDVLLAISTSGNSGNVIEAVSQAHSQQMQCILLDGGDGGKLATLMQPGDIEIRIPAQATARIQEVHGLVIHCLCEVIDHHFSEETPT